MVTQKVDLEIQLKDEHELIKEGLLRDESPLDTSPEFQELCIACRIGDVQRFQKAITTPGININARDPFDYTPLILASLCGHYNVVELLLEAGALCERDTFQGERCLYNALNNRIRNLLLKYDYSKSTNPLQPFASHITSLLTRQIPKTSDITLNSGSESWNLHKMILSARSPYFRRKLLASPETKSWKLAPSIPPESFQITLRYLYMGEIPSDLGLKSNSSVDDVLIGIEKISKQLEIESLWEVLFGRDRRIARQRHQDEISRGRDQLESWYRGNVLNHKIHIDTVKAKDVKWTRNNAIFADVLLQADEDLASEEGLSSGQETPTRNTSSPSNGIPVGPSSSSSQAISANPPQKSILCPAHKAMLIRSEYFQTMFSSSFQEAQATEHLQIIYVDCSPAVLELILEYLYTDNVDIPLNLAIDVLLAADMLFIEKLKTKAAVVISTLGNGSSTLADRTHVESDEPDVELINPYDVMRAGWLTRVQRLEEFSARYLAYRLEDYIDDPEFEELIKESADRIEKRQETDTIELLDDIRFYLSERFRLRFEDSGIEEMMDENGEITNNNPVEDGKSNEGADANQTPSSVIDPTTNGQIRTLDGKIVGDEFAADAINYQVLLGKIDTLLERLKLDA
ncbi:hypothetical protein MFRU_004g02160 [Monilinia fructicola]|uniref:BTB domain-containing protein n=1 Tax=Monilinia fructicola TaxID=38448 RepID=A0A5M9JNR6_MONFR|nr:hypothetical protein EYC84_001068 [Monilinia fructicola]KAG4033713.1 hypothetical protein MFRU_004g02160 [Monilinia fructicola]